MCYRNTSPVKSLYPEGAGFLYNFLVIHTKTLHADGLWNSIGLIIEDAETKTCLTYDVFKIPDTEERRNEVDVYKAMPKYTFDVKEVDILEFERKECMVSEVERQIELWKSQTTEQTPNSLI